MIEFNSAEAKIRGLIELLNVSGGLDITAQFEQLADVLTDSPPRLMVDLSGQDESLLVYNNGELLEAIQTIADQSLRLGPHEHDQLWFDVHRLKENRRVELHRLAAAAAVRVQESGERYEFPAMIACERRLLHLALAPSGLRSASQEPHGKRCVVLYPQGVGSTRKSERPSNSSNFRKRVREFA